MDTARHLDAAEKPQVMAGLALALGFTAYGLFAKRRQLGESGPRPSSERSKWNWWNLSRRIVDNIWKKNIPFIAAGAAFYGFLALPAGLAVLVSLFLLFFDQDAIRRVVQAAGHVVPGYVTDLLSSPHSRQTLGIGLVVTLALDLKTVFSGSSCMLTAFKLIYGEKTKQGFIHRQMTILVLTAVSVPFTIASLVLIALLPIVFSFLPLSAPTKTIVSIGRWPFLVVLFWIVLAAIYRFAPNRPTQRWQWLSWGTAAAIVLWIGGSALFTLYMSKFLPSDRTYGAIGVVIIVLAWLNFTAFVVLLGAQIDIEIEQEREMAASNTSMARHPSRMSPRG